jgi:pyruvate decarboxylase
MKSTTVGLYLAKRLEEIGITDYFAIPGDYNLSLLDEMLKNPRLKMINCCNELNCGYAADGYARGKGVSALFVTFSVGGLSALNAIAGAYAEDLPVIVISGSPNINSIAHNHVLHHTLGKTDDRQEYVRQIFSHVTAHTVVIDNLMEAAYQIDLALSIALRKKKPVYIEIACNLANQPISLPHPLDLKVKRQSDKDSLAAAVEHAARFLNASRQPVLIAGAKLRSFNAMEAFKKLADSSEYGVACMPNSKGFFSETHSRFIGIYWGSVSSPGCREVVESSDAYLFAGPIFSDYTTVGFTYLISSKKLVEAGSDHVRLEGQSYQGVMLADFLEHLAKKIKKNKTSYKTFAHIKGEAKTPEVKTLNEPITTRRLFAYIDEMLDSKTTVLAETGDSWFNGMRLHLPNQARFEIQMQYGSIGWSVGAFLGLAAANPERKIIGLIGDGSFQMSAQELSTFLRYGYTGIVFLMNNSGYTIEVKIHDGPYNNVQNWHYSTLIDAWKGQSKGISFVVKTEKELLSAIKKSKNFKGLSLIEVILDREDCNKFLLSWGSAVADYNSTPPSF